MDLRFIITITEHRILGYIFVPYLVKPDRQKGNYAIYDRISQLNLSNYENAISPEEVQLVKIIEEYNEQNLFRIFSKKKKQTSRDFIACITGELLEKHIRPYIEKRMTRCLDIFLFNPVPVYQKLLQNNVYESDRVSVVEQEGSVVFNFIRSEQGLQYFLSIEHNETELHLKGTEGIIIMNEPCGALIGNKMFVFRDIDGKKLQPFFEKEFISIPRTAEKKYFETFIRNAIKKNKVHARGFTITDLDADPEPVLSIEPDLNGRYFYSLKFLYDDKTIYYANRKTELKVTCEFEDDSVYFRRLKRKYEFENHCIATLLSYGLVNREGPYFMPLAKNTEERNTRYETINWINCNHGLLQKAGFSIVQNKLEKEYFLDDVEMKIEVSEMKNDWFDIHASVTFGEYKIPFASISANILKGEREFMLPDGKVVILPAEWFENYRDVLSFSKIEKDSIRLEKQHFPILNKNLKGLSDTVKNKLLNLIDTKAQVEEVPENITAELRNYQVEGYSWLYRLYKNGFGGCLADDMGLGKTLQTLTVLQRIHQENVKEPETAPVQPVSSGQLSLFDNLTNHTEASHSTSLIIVPTSLVHNWLNESKRFVPDLKVITYVGPGRKKINELYGQFDIILTSYGILRNDLEQFLPLSFQYIVLDESQVIKNPGSKTYQSVIQLKAENRIVLTGTPIENSLTDMWSQMNFLNPGLLGNLTFFQSEFQGPIEKKADENKQDKLLKLISPFVLRRSKMQVEPELPPVSEQIIYCDMNDSQEAYYEKEKSKARNFVIEKLSKEGFHKSAIAILQSLTKLRQIANHPALVDEEYFSGSGKYEEIMRNLHNLQMEGHKALIFSSFVKHLNLVASHFDKVGVPYAWLTGETHNREKEIDKFQNSTEYSFFLISLKAGGVGLNLTAAEYVFILDPWWNPAAELQAISRAHRIGQDKHVFVYRFISRNTLEEKILHLQERKNRLADAFVNNSMSGITQEEVMGLFD